MDTDVTATTGSISQSGTPTPDEHQKQGSDTDGGQEAGQLEADAEAEAGMIDGETDAEVDLEAVGWSWSGFSLPQYWVCKLLLQKKVPIDSDLNTVGFVFTLNHYT